ncbi:putative lipase ROG1 isoform X2 [Olea europaea var. sylvestris]|uniref:putative lipase ROG1 isoform X2 n=1 Tax=Olea europaea var. sylvestris TaxID=158386 RepID=UPI000C1D5B3A|nr:putative lipase ROG1 isoform X2 [Olea europaea var. sylvestris]
MGSLEMEASTETVREEENKKAEIDLNVNKLGIKNVKNITTKKKKSKFHFIPNLGCMKLNDEFPAVSEKPDSDGGFDVEAGCNQKNHLIVMVNGIIGSAQNWRYAAKQFVKAYPSDVVVHCSESNSSMLTFDGVDVMGTRLADEVISVVAHYPNLQKISFVGHSLGGLIARYAIARLYQQDLSGKPGKENGECERESNRSFAEEKSKDKIAGLEPVNFITFATPHLGSRGHKQVPVFCGLYSMEKVASRASWLLGRTGKHLFLTDSDDGKPPLLLQMVNDTEDLKFISSLHSFKRRVAYANARFDHLVGWSSSSLRRRNELPKRRNLQKHAKYPHIFNEVVSETDKPQEVHLEAKIARGKTSEMEEEMMRSLTRLSWDRIDVNFGGSIQRFLAHNTIQVKTYCINSAGADVIQHMIENFVL